MCRGCGAYTQPRNGKGDAYAYCKAGHPGAMERRWNPDRVFAAMRGSTPPASPAPRRSGAERMERMLRYALPGGEGAMRTAVWEFKRPMLSPALAALHRDNFVVEDETASTVDLAGRHAATSLDELDLGEPDGEAA